MKTYENEMRICLKLAQKGEGKTSPNPKVGCVILDKKGNMISTGYHKKYGEFHAERDALLKIKKNEGYTLIVNLEPCCHFGKTPPCTDIIIEKGIKEIVFGMKDPNPIVAGKGLGILKKAGIKLIGPVMENECKKLNEFFIKNKTSNMPFVAIKTATTIDGKIATKSGDSKWITSEKARQKGKKLREKFDSILTSSATIIADNPEMKHKNKIILDRYLKTDIKSKIYQNGNIFIFCEHKPNKSLPNIEYIQTPIKNNRLDIKFILEKLYELGIMSVFVEAGGHLNNSFLPFADRLYHFTAPKILSDNSGMTCFDGDTKDKINDCFELIHEKTLAYPPDILNIYSIAKH